jgi:hypothetical protein
MVVLLHNRHRWLAATAGAVGREAAGAAGLTARSYVDAALLVRQLAVFTPTVPAARPATRAPRTDNFGANAQGAGCAQPGSRCGTPVGGGA